MIERDLTATLRASLAQYPAVALLGARQVGKTTLARAVCDTGAGCEYLDMENPVDCSKLSDPVGYLERLEGRLVVLDEVQRMPNLFQPLRGLIDQGRRRGIDSGRFLLLGSASGDLLRQSGESLAGRIAYLELPPLQVGEVSDDAVETLWLRGGFPDSFLALDAARSLRWRQNLISTYLERDIPAYGGRVPATTLRRLWTMLVHQQGGMLNVSQLAGNLGLDGKTTNRYLDMLGDLMLLRRLPPWHANLGKRLVKSPKIYLRDSGLLHALLGVADIETLYGHPVFGASWEGFVIENILNAVPFNTQASFYRTTGGAEVDLLLDLPGEGLWAIEIKHSQAARPGRGFYSACADLQPKRRLWVNAGQDAYPLGEGVEVLGLRALLQQLRGDGG